MRADQIEAATGEQVIGAAAGARRRQLPARFQPAPLHRESRAYGLMGKGKREQSIFFALGRWRLRLTRTAHIEHRDVGRQAIGNTDDSAFQVDRAGYVNTLAQRAFYFEVGVPGIAGVEALSLAIGPGDSAR